jgi:hypothetical protein
MPDIKSREFYLKVFSGGTRLMARQYFIQQNTQRTILPSSARERPPYHELHISTHANAKPIT